MAGSHDIDRSIRDCFQNRLAIRFFAQGR